MYKKLAFLSFLSIPATLVFTKFAHAVCPICTIAVGVGVGLTRKYGIDDTVSGLWVGGLLISSSMWTVNWLKNRQTNFPLRGALITLAYYAVVLIPLYEKNVISQKIIGDHYQTLWGVDRLLLGILIGTAGFLAGELGYEFLKAKNGGKTYFPYQKVVMPVATLIILSAIFYFITQGR